MTEDIARRLAPDSGKEEDRTPAKMPKADDEALTSEAHEVGVAAVARALDQAE
jgi:hypothetical protein